MTARATILILFVFLWACTASAGSMDNNWMLQQQRMQQQQLLRQQQQQQLQQQQRLQQQQLQQQQLQQQRMQQQQRDQQQRKAANDNLQRQQRQQQQLQALQRQKQDQLARQRRQAQEQQQKLQAQRAQKLQSDKLRQQQQLRVQQQGKSASDNLQRQQTESKRQALERLRKLAQDKTRRDRLAKQKKDEAARSKNSTAVLALLSRLPSRSGGSYSPIATGTRTSVGNYAASNSSRTVGYSGNPALTFKKRPEVEQAERSLLARVKKSIATNDKHANNESTKGIIVTSKGVAIPNAVLAKQGASQLTGNFKGLAGSSVEDIISRIPKEWKMVRQDRGAGVKFLDEAGFERIRLHGPSSSAPPGSNSASGWTLRIMDRAGNYYDSEGNVVPFRADAGHIPIRGNANLP